MRPPTEIEYSFAECKELPDIAGTYRGTLLILGGGSTMWEDMAKAKSFSSVELMATNMTGIHVKDRITHLFSFHHKELPLVKSLRIARFPDESGVISHCTNDKPGIDYFWNIEHRCSFSGLGAIYIGLMLGYRKIILCGVPMDGGGYYYQPYINQQTNDEHRIKEIRQIRNKVGDYVRSMSGVTKEILGEPTKEWVEV